jgi:PAS domain S-box-containing protein
LSSLDAALTRWFDELSTQGILVTDEQLVVRRWNRWLERHTGIAAEAAIGQPLFTLYPDLVTRGLDQYFADALAGSARVLSQRFHGYLLPIIVQQEGRAATPMSQTASIAPLIEGDRLLGVVALITDVTERVSSERRLRQEIAASDRSRKTAEEALRLKDEFLTTLSHEIRTPLNAVLGWTKLLRGKGSHSEVVDRGLEVIDRNASAQAKLIEDLLDMARVVSGKLRLAVTNVSLAPVLGTAVDVIRPAADAKNITLSLVVQEDLPPITADADRVLQILWNLLSNAVKFTPPGGRVDVEVTGDDADVRVVVRDTGEGIKAEFLPFIFERFRQQEGSQERHGGLGIGLALVRQLVELHGGSISASSKGPNQGSTFTVTLPVTHRYADVASGEIAAAPPLLGLRILVVRGDTSAASSLAAALSAAGAAATAAESADTVFLELSGAATGTRPNVLMIDLDIADDRAFSLAEQIRALGSGIGSDVLLLALAREVRAEHEMRLMAAGFDGVVSESRETRQLVEAVRRLALPPVSPRPLL